MFAFSYTFIFHLFIYLFHLFQFVWYPFFFTTLFFHSCFTMYFVFFISFFFGGTAAAATAEEFPDISNPPPITHRDGISRSGQPLTPTSRESSGVKTIHNFPHPPKLIPVGVKGADGNVSNLFFKSLSLHKVRGDFVAHLSGWDCLGVHLRDTF